MFDELRNELRATVDGLRDGTATRTIAVAKPYCFPARNIITGALQPYGVKVHAIREEVIRVSLLDFARRMRVELRTWDNLRYGPAALVFLPMAIHARVTVNEPAAAWAEYLLLRTGKLYVPGAYVDPRNAAWAARHGGRMPPQWNEGKPWIEASCKEGISAWQPVKATASKRPK